MCVTFGRLMEQARARGVSQLGSTRRRPTSPTGNDSTQAEWDYFVSKVSDGVSAGWLEGVTFEDLLARGGLRFRRGLGDVAVELPGVDGSVSSVRLP